MMKPRQEPVTKKGGVPTYTQNHRTPGIQPDSGLPYCTQTSILIQHLVCWLTPVSAYYELKTHHSQQQNNTDKALIPSSFHSNTHTHRSTEKRFHVAYTDHLHSESTSTLLIRVHQNTWLHSDRANFLSLPRSLQQWPD
jgi:hypothetical protein